MVLLFSYPTKGIGYMARFSATNCPAAGICDSLAHRDFTLKWFDPATGGVAFVRDLGMR